VNFGSQSSAGSRFVERMLTAAESCRRQGRNLLDLLTAAVTAWITGAPPPSLVAAP
jgi:transposase